MKRTAFGVGNIRRGRGIALLLCCLAVVLGGCDPFQHDEIFDKTLLSGYWVSGTLHEHYNANGTGYTWDTADDVTEEEAQPFTWTLEGPTLTQIHKMEMGGNVPKTYTVTKLNTTTLAYHDDYGKSYTFTKQ